MVIQALDTGGAEWAFVRMANAMTAMHEITAYVPWVCDSSPALVSALDSRIRLVSLPLPWSWMHSVTYKLSLLFPRLALERRIHRFVLRLLNHLERFHAVNPHLQVSTQIACDAFKHTRVPIIESDHGDYALLKKEDPEMKHSQPVFLRLDAIVCPAEANHRIMRDMPWKAGFRSIIIPYAAPAYSRFTTTTSSSSTKNASFTFGLISRGIADKGWAEALAAFRLLQKQVATPMRLVFVGEGPEIQRLRYEVASDEAIIFAGHQADPTDWISRFDVGLLPSCFTAESLPNVIIECQLQGKPVIATRIGGIPEMLEPDGHPCGILIPISPATGRADVPSLASAMQRLMEDRTFHAACTAAAYQASARYSPQSCATAYSDFFASMIPHV